ncbi:MAG: SRPBCC family protein [Marinobacter sp.]
MAINVSIELSRELEIAGSYDEVFDLLADVPRSVSHFPKVHKLTDLGNNSYLWEMEKVGVDKYSIQTAYACHYVSDRDAGTIRWEPVAGQGNGVVSGSWVITAKGDTMSKLKFKTNAKLTLSLPSLLKLAISPVIKHEFNSLVDQYMRNLKKVFA